MTHKSRFPFYESSPVKAALESWVNAIANQSGAENIHWCDGTKQDYDNLCAALVKKGTFIKLNEEKRPNTVSYTHLDVYKRQSQLNPLRPASTCAVTSSMRLRN